MIRGAALTEMGQYTAAEEVVRTALGRAELLDLRDAGGLAWALLGRIQLLRRELRPARRSLERSLERTRAAGWVAFLPSPEAFLVEGVDNPALGEVVGAGPAPWSRMPGPD